MLRRPSLLGPIVLLCGCAALAQDLSPAAILPSAGTPPLDYLLGLGPIGALVWGAYLLGKGVTITLAVKVDLTEATIAQLAKLLVPATAAAAARSGS